VQNKLVTEEGRYRLRLDETKHTKSNRYELFIVKQNNTTQ